MFPEDGRGLKIFNGLLIALVVAAFVWFGWSASQGHRGGKTALERLDPKR